MRLIASFFWPAILASVIGCGGSNLTPGEERADSFGDEKIEVEAYLFDARYYDHGKPTSFRLNVYYTDSIMAVGGKGYFGKGALKGWMRPDSLRVYFPSTKEYLFEAIDDLMRLTDCAVEPVRLDILACFTRLPDEFGNADGLTIVGKERDDRKAAFTLYQTGCDWQLDLEYDLRDTGWRLKEFNFTDGSDTRLRARRREFKPNADVRIRRFMLSIPQTAVRILP